MSKPINVEAQRIVKIINDTESKVIILNCRSAENTCPIFSRLLCRNQNKVVYLRSIE